MDWSDYKHSCEGTDIVYKQIANINQRNKSSITVVIRRINVIICMGGKHSKIKQINYYGTDVRAQE